MAPTSAPKAPQTRQHGTEKIAHKLQKLFQRTDKADLFPHPHFKDYMRFSRNHAQERNASPLNEISERFQRYMDDVDQPQHHQVLTSMLDFKNGRQLTRCVCLGLGPFAVDGPHSTQSDISLHQLAVLTTMLRLLKHRHGIQQVYFQDPAFGDADKMFLQSLGYTVLETPAAYEKMSTGTFLFAPFLAYYVTAAALAVGFPGLYVGNSPSRYLVSLGLCEVSPEERGKECLDVVDVFRRFEGSVVDGEALPGFERQGWTRGTSVHWLAPDFASSSGGKG